MLADTLLFDGFLEGRSSYQRDVRRTDVQRISSVDIMKK